MTVERPITWQIIANALAGIVLVMGSVIMASFNARLTAAEATLNSRGERIALLERQAVLNRNDIDKIGTTLDRINETLIRISYEHQQMEGLKKRQ